MSLSYDLDNLSVTFTIGDLPKDIQDNLLSTLDINGFIQNEPKFREIVATNIHKLEGVSPETAKKLIPIIKAGNLLPLERDAEKNQYGLNFLLNKYIISLDVVPGRPEINKEGTKVLSIIGISKQNDYYITAYEDGEGNYRYAGRIKPFLAREKLFVEPLEETSDVLWIDPRKFKKVKVTHTALQYSLQDTFTISEKVTQVGKKLSAIAKDMKVIALVDDPSPLSQVAATPVVDKEAKMPPLKEIQQIVKDEKWQALREGLSWTKENISSSLHQLRQYLGINPSRKKKVRVLNLLNGVARGGIMNDPIERMQNSLRKQLGVGEKTAVMRERICAWCEKKMGEKEVPSSNKDATHGICPECLKKHFPEYSKNRKQAALSETPPVETIQKEGHTYTARVKESEETSPMGNWKIEVDEDGKTILSTKLIKWPGKDYEIIDSFVMTDAGTWEAADESDIDVINKLKDLLIVLVAKYEGWSKSVGPKSDLGGAEYWKSYDKLHGIEKDAAFMPSIGRQPFWDQHSDGGGTGDYKYPLETLYPREWWDTWNAYTQMNAKTDPGVLLNLLRKLKLSKEDTKLEKRAILEMDPDIAFRFYIPQVSITMPESSGIGGEYEATFLGSKPSSAERLRGVDPDDKKIPFLGKTPAEKIQEGKVPVLPIPQEGERAPIYFLPGLPGTSRGIGNDKPFKPLTNTNEVIYQIKYVKGDVGTPGAVIGYFDAMDFLTHFVKKGQERKGLQEWITNRLTARTGEIKKFFNITNPDRELKERLGWKARLLQASISEDWDEALKAAKDSGLSSEEIEPTKKAIASQHIMRLFREQNFVELADAIKKHKQLPTAWSKIDPSRWEESKALLPILGGKTAKPSSSDYPGQVNLILKGNDVFLKGGSIDAKRNVIRDIEIPRLLEFILSDKFLSEPYAVQSVAVRRLEASGTSGEEGLFVVWKKKDLPATLRKEALNALVLAYGVGKESRGYSSTGRFKATKNLLTEAAEDTDADIRAAAYMLMKDPSVDFLPWTTKGKLTYSPSQAQGRKEQPSRDIPEWMLVQLRNEPYSELRNILFDIIEELPKNLVKEDQPPKLSSELKILEHGKYSFKEELLPGVAQLILAALTDTDIRVRARIRSYFNLPREIDFTKGEKAEPKSIEPSAKNYIFYVKVALSQNNIEDAEKQLVAATKANDATEYKEELDSLQKRIVEAREAAKNREELEKKLSELQKTIRDKHSLSPEQVKAFFDWVARIKHNVAFDDLSLKNKVDILSFLSKDAAWYAHWSKSPETPAEKVVQPELPLTPEDAEDKPFEKRGSPLSFLELTARQPPTTWPLSNPGPGYSSAFPLGAKDDDLLLKDVRQYYGRPEGKWRSLLNQIYDMLFKKKEESVADLPKTAAELPEDEPGFKLPEDEKGLIEAVNRFPDNKQLLKEILQAAEDKGFLKAVQVVMSLPHPSRPAEDDIHRDAIQTLFKMNAVPELEKLIFTLWHPLAVKYLIELGRGPSLKATFKAYPAKSSLQRSIVLYLGEEGDIDFLEEALKSPNEEVRHQAVEWLTHHKQFDILRKYLGKETDSKTKAVIEKSLAMADEGPAAGILRELTPEEQEKKISELIKLATTAFTRWDSYPEIRRRVLGQRGERFSISTFNEWATSQKEIDAEINKEMASAPTISQGRAALRDLEKIVEKLPDATKRVSRLKEWVAEAEEKYNNNKNRQSDMSDEHWTQIQQGLSTLQKKIKDAREAIEKFEQGHKADLEFRVAQLKLMEQAAMYRESLMELITKNEQFKKDYGLSSRTWKDYQAYLMTFDKDLDLSQPQAHSTKKGIDELEKKQVALEEKYAEPLQKELSKAQQTLFSSAEKLASFYKGLGIPVGKDREPIVPGVIDLRNQIWHYRRLAAQWFKLAGAIEPYETVEGVRYHMAPALWVSPSESTSLPEYARGKRLVHERVAELHSPWTPLIAETEKKIADISKDFVGELIKKLPTQGKEFLKEKENNRIYKDKLQAALAAIRAQSSKQAAKERMEAKKEYEELNKSLLSRLKESEALREKNPKEYIRLQVDLKEFMKRYAVPPIPEGPEANLKKQYFHDRWRSPGLRGPRGTPQLITPTEEETPYSGGSDFTDAERIAIEKEIARRVAEYGAPKFEGEK